MIIIDNPFCLCLLGLAEYPECLAGDVPLYGSAPHPAILIIVTMVAGAGVGFTAATAQPESGSTVPDLGQTGPLVRPVCHILERQETEAAVLWCRAAGTEPHPLPFGSGVGAGVGSSGRPSSPSLHPPGVVCWISTSSAVLARPCRCGSEHLSGHGVLSTGVTRAPPGPQTSLCQGELG